MTLSDRYLIEQTLFSLYENPPLNATNEALNLALKQVIYKINDTNGAWTRSNMRGISKAIADELNIAYEPLLPLVMADSIDQIKTSSLFKLDRKTIDNIVNKDNIVQGYTVKDLFKTQQDNHIKQMQVIFAANASRGAPVNEIVLALKDKNKTLTNNQLKSAIITMGNEARAKTRHENFKTMEEDGLIDGYVYDATLDSRTTEYCRNHDGRVYHKSIDEIKGEINVHFRCRSVFRPYTEDVKTRASIFGQTENVSYGEWFKKQDESFQRLTLGTKKYNLYKDGSYKVGSIVDLRDSTITLEQIQEHLLIFTTINQFVKYYADKNTESNN